MRKIVVVSSDRPAAFDPGPAPMQQWIKIEQLVVDDSYQRDLKPGNWKAIRNIAANFKWSRFSPVFCAPIEGGLFAIIDGQHRTHAAAMCGFDTVPCQIVQMSKDEQAASFAAVNGMVTKITSLNLHKAALAAGEAWAVQAHKVAEDAGCKLMISNRTVHGKKPGEIYAPKAFAKLIETRKPEAITKALRILMAADGYRDVLEIWDTSILIPLVAGMTVEPATLDDPRMVRCLEDFDLWTVMDGLSAELKRRLRLALPYEPKKAMFQSAVEKWISRYFGERVAS